MPSNPGAYRYERRGEIVRCPWHGWEFDLRSGQSWFDPVHTRVRSYEVRVEPGAAVARGPYVAETYRVSVEDQYVVVEV
jgi:3-phenylpropionate/trans-cinnamate dioxygenase ferredoxin subunit